MGEYYRSALTQTDLISAATVTTTAGQFVKLGERKILAGETIGLGYGDASGQDNAVGRLFMDLKDSTPANVNGIVRLSIYSPQNRPLIVLHEFRTETLRMGSTVRDQQIPFPIGSAWASEDKKIVLEFMADASGLVNRTNTTILLDITVEAV